MDGEATCGNCVHAVRCFGPRGWYRGCRLRDFAAVWPAGVGCAEHERVAEEG